MTRNEHDQKYGSVILHLPVSSSLKSDNYAITKYNEQRNDIVISGNLHQAQSARLSVRPFLSTYMYKSHPQVEFGTPGMDTHTNFLLRLHQVMRE